MVRVEFATGPLAANACPVFVSEGNKVATDVPVSDNPARDRHQLKTLILAVATVVMILIAVGLAIAGAGILDQYWFLHFPLGFYLLAQGVLIFIVAVGFWFTRTQEHVDRARSESEELT
jgi:putative solute:sodium symporter small subunit